MSGLSQKVCYDFRDQISKKINRLPLAYFEKRTVGEVLSRITNDVDTLGQSLNQSVTQLITQRDHHDRCAGDDALHQSPHDPDCPADLTGIAGAGAGGGQVQPEVFQGAAGDTGRCQRSGRGGLLRPQRHQAFNREAAVLDDFNAANDKLYESAWKSQFLSGLMQPIMNFVGNLAM